VAVFLVKWALTKNKKYVILNVILLKEINFMENKDFLDGWRSENNIGYKGGVKTSSGPHYEGGSEDDPTVRAILEYLKEEELKKKTEEELIK